MCKRILCYIFEVWDLGRFQRSERHMTVNVTQSLILRPIDI